MPFPLARDNKHTDARHPLSKYSDDDLDALLADKKDPLVLVLDGLQDPHNLGACLRTADCAGVDLVVITRKHSAPVNETVRRIACGGAENIPILLAANLRNTLDRLKKLGVWIAGTSDHKDGKFLWETDLRGPLALVMGAEGEGIRHLTGQTCDFLVKIPMFGKVPCLNVSVATGVCLFEAVRQRRAGGKRR
ncbi:MAG: 23S rRNA (guanosine(2251)-2'-O)-methyltransferase RlmB [Puniceicoccales bacterium]|jgi:23S rRNA (guanosine2251-2'-O)-methyltransferase|nr:23S rRNA (guanosine(2251)-2'-O)-methyltransferase RlmB [Puniceicoccales bacterium]